MSQVMSNVVPFRSKGVFMGFDSIDELEQVLRACPLNSGFFYNLTYKYVDSSEIKIIINDGRFPGINSRFLVIAAIKDVGQAVLEILPENYGIKLLAVFNSKGEDIKGKSVK